MKQHLVHKKQLKLGKLLSNHMFYQTPFTAQRRRNVTKIGDNKPTTVWQNLPPNGALFVQGFLITEVYENKYCMKLKVSNINQLFFLNINDGNRF